MDLRLDLDADLRQGRIEDIQLPMQQVFLIFTIRGCWHRCRRRIFLDVTEHNLETLLGNRVFVFLLLYHGKSLKKKKINAGVIVITVENNGRGETS